MQLRESKSVQCVHYVVPGGAAAARGVTIGDGIVAINGASMLREPHDNVISALTNSGAVLRLTLAPQEAAAAAAAAAALGTRSMTRSHPNLGAAVNTPAANATSASSNFERHCARV
jgi:predicted metalloprotease with PDZ domain